MRGARRFFLKEVAEMLRTWRLPVVGGVVLFFAITGPVLALLTPELLKSMQASAPGVVIQLPEPIWRDAYAQWVKNLTQIVSFVAIITAAGSVAGEVSSGTASLVLTKPVSRSGFVFAKAAAFYALLASSVVAGAAVTQAVTLLVFGEAPAAELWLPTLVWLAFAALLVSIATVLSCVVSTLAAAGIGIGAFFVISLAALWGPAVTYSPAGLTSAPSQLLLGNELALGWPVASTLVVCAGLLSLGAWLFTRREL